MSTYNYNIDCPECGAEEACEVYEGGDEKHEHLVKIQVCSKCEFYNEERVESIPTSGWDD